MPVMGPTCVSCAGRGSRVRGCGRPRNGPEVDRKPTRRSVEAGEAAGPVRDGAEVQLTDELIGVVVAAVRPGAGD